MPCQCHMLCAALLQEMQLKIASSADNMQEGPLIPAVWGKSAVGAVQILEHDGDEMQQSTVSQV